MNSAASVIELLLIVAIAGGLYFLPWIVAHRRGNLNKGAVAVVDIFLGWTFVGWVVALAMAFGGTVAPAALRSAPRAVPGCPVIGHPCPHPASAHRWRRRAVACKACPCAGPVVA